jgi:hypothetical protein
LKKRQNSPLFPTPVAMRGAFQWIHISFRRSEIRSDQRVSEDQTTGWETSRVRPTTIFAPMFTYFPMSRSQHFPAPRGRAGQPGPGLRTASRAQWTRGGSLLATRDKVCDSRRTADGRANPARPVLRPPSCRRARAVVFSEESRQSWIERQYRQQPPRARRTGHAAAAPHRDGRVLAIDRRPLLRPGLRRQSPRDLCTQVRGLP